MKHIRKGKWGPTWRSRMRPSSDLIFLCGHRGIPNSLHFFLSTVSPTFRFLEASTIGRSKYLARSDKAIFATCSLGALFFFFSIIPATLHLTYEISNLNNEQNIFLRQNLIEYQFLWKIQSFTISYISKCESDLK